MLFNSLTCSCKLEFTLSLIGFWDFSYGILLGFISNGRLLSIILFDYWGIYLAGLEFPAIGVGAQYIPFFYLLRHCGIRPAVELLFFYSKKE